MPDRKPKKPFLERLPSIATMADAAQKQDPMFDYRRYRTELSYDRLTPKEIDQLEAFAEAHNMSWTHDEPENDNEPTRVVMLFFDRFTYPTARC